MNERMNEKITNQYIHRIILPQLKRKTKHYFCYERCYDYRINNNNNNNKSWKLPLYIMFMVYGLLFVLS